MPRYNYENSNGFQGDPWYQVFGALMSIDNDDLSEAIDIARNNNGFTDDFRYGLESLQAFRDYYGDNMTDYTQAQIAQIAAYDEEWALELLDAMHRQKFGVPSGDAAPEYEIS